MDELERMRACFALRQLEAMVGPVDKLPVPLVAVNGERKSRPEPRGKLRLAK